MLANNINQVTQDDRPKAVIDHNCKDCVCFNQSRHGCYNYTPSVFMGCLNALTESNAKEVCFYRFLQHLLDNTTDAKEKVEDRLKELQKEYQTNGKLNYII